MTKRILAFALVLAMLVSVLPVQLVAAEPVVATHGHSDAHQCSDHCPGGTVTWKPWGITNGSKTTFPTQSGHYYLECDVTLSARVEKYFRYFPSVEFSRSCVDRCGKKSVLETVAEC